MITLVIIFTHIACVCFYVTGVAATKEPATVFQEIARAQEIKSDKVNAADFTKKTKDHSYQTMYGFMLPYIERQRARGKRIKMLEVGLGKCPLHDSRTAVQHPRV